MGVKNCGSQKRQRGDRVRSWKVSGTDTSRRKEDKEGACCRRRPRDRNEADTGGHQTILGGPQKNMFYINNYVCLFHCVLATNGY